MKQDSSIFNRGNCPNNKINTFVFSPGILTIVLFLLSIAGYGQLTGIKYVPGDYSTITAAVSAVNTSGVGTGGVTFNIAAGYTETVAATISLTATGTAANPIIFQKDPATSGVNPLITAYTGGTGTPSTSVQDGIWRLSGSDYVTINGIDVRDNPANTTNPSTMEYGYALYKASSSNGCQYVTIKNCTVTLNSINNASSANPMTEGCTGITIMNAAASSAIVVYGAVAGGSNSNNKIYSNTIQNCNYGICAIGATDASPFANADMNNDIGGNSASTGNTIINFGGATGATNPAAAIRTQGQYGLNVSYNTINNNNGAGANHPFTLRGLHINSATSANSTVSYNTITLNGGGTTQNIYAIDNSSGTTAAGNIVNINNNTITNSTYATATTGSFYGIYNTAAPSTLNINYNTFTGNSTSSASGLCVAVYNSGAVSSGLNINNNNIGNSATGAFTFNAANSGVQTFINNAGGSSTAALSISNNNFQGITYAVQGSGVNNYIFNGAVTLSQAINNNTFTGLNINTTGSITFINNSVIVSATGTQNVNNNSIVTSFTKSAAGGTVTLFTSAATSAANAVINNNNNNFSNITLTGATVLDGWVNTDGGPSIKTIQNNTFSNWTAGTGLANGMNVNLNSPYAKVTGNLINNISGAGTVTGIATAAGSEKIYGNTINTLSTTGTTVTGILITSGTNKNVYGNKIYDLQLNNTGGSVSGILISNNTLVSVNVYNNLIGDLKAPIASTSSDVIRGINVTAFSTNSMVNLYYNTIYLNATSSGANFSTSGIYHSASATATTATLNLRNNIITNTSTPKGTGITVAYRRSSNVLANYASTSNNNIFYAGASATNRLIFYDGTNSDITLTNYKARVTPIDAQSVTEDLPGNSKFISTSGASVNYLHLDAAKATLAENGAVNITGFSTDYDATIRQGNTDYAGPGTSPDIGADEINGTKLSALSGTYNVGTGQVFTSLTNAGGLFAAINSIGLSGNVIVNITSDLAEDGSNTLYQWAEQGVGNYILTIQPSASGVRIIGGDVLGGLIRLNGAKRVTINGSNGTTSNNLTFRNTNTTGTTGTAFTFINGASNNTIRYCNIEAYANATNSVVLFSTSTESGGNSNNLIGNCNINATVSANTGNVGIYSAGTSTTGYANSNNTISNNSIYNYRDKGLDITATGSTGWTISGNSFYNGDVTAAINYAANSLLYSIRVLGGTGYTVTNNYIGGNAGLAAGTAASYSSSTGLISYDGILLTTSSATPASNIKGNTIANISIAAAPTSNSGVGTPVFFGIETNGSGINIGGTLADEGNMIGSNTVNGSISVTTTTDSINRKSNVRGINCASSGGQVIGNQVGGIDIKNIGPLPGPTLFIGIYINNALAPSQVNNNVIGSNGAGAATNSIRILATSTSTSATITGISISGSVASTMQVNANVIQNITNAVAGSTASFIGIASAAISPAVVSITSNTIAGNTTTSGIFSIYNSGTLPSLTISNNTISGNSSTATASGYLYGIYIGGNPVAITINNNIFSGNSTAALTATGFSGITNFAASSTLTIMGNSFYGNVVNSATGSFFAVYNSGAVTSAININSNNVGTGSSGAVTFTTANSAGQFFLDNIGGATTASLSISNNNFQGINYSALSSGNNTYIYNSVGTLSQAINGNTFTNLNVNISGNITFISNSVALTSTGIQNVNNNSIVGTFTKSAGNTVTLFTSTATCAAGSVTNNLNNNFSNITVSGATGIAGWVNTDVGSSTKTIQNNIFTNWTGGTGVILGLYVNINGTNSTTGNTISNISSAGTITGISTTTGNDNIYANNINTLITTGAVPVNGISVTAGTTKNIYKNKIYDLQAGTSTAGTVNGILVSGGTTVNIYNNLIGNLRTPAASASDPIRGISVISTTASSVINVYYNTVYINATSTGTNFGTTGIYHTTSTTATTSSLNLRNNSVTNTSTPNGSGYIAAYRLSSSTLTNYAGTSDNNMFYAGTPGTKKLIFWDGTTGDQTIAAYKMRVSTRDASSVTEDITAKFLSTAGSSSVFLHMDSTIASVIKNGAANISGYTDDYDGQIRNGNSGYSGASSAPSIGADEAFGIEIIAPAITYTLLSNTTSIANRSVIGISVTDASGVNTVTGTRPRIYFKRTSDSNVLLDNSSITSGWKYAEATNSSSPFSFTIDYSLLYGGASVTAGVIQYFIVAQDLATTANIGINSGTFTVAPTSVALTSAAFPITGSINSYSIAFSGTYNVGSSEVYTSLTKADGLFAAINSAGLMGNATFNITSNLSEDGTVALNQWTESGAGNYTITIQPDAATPRIISGNGPNGLIRLNGADRVTIDGSNGGSGSYLSIINTNTSGTTGTALTFINGATNNAIRYCDAEAYANATNGVVLFSNSTVAGGNSNNLIDNCTINATMSGNTGETAIYSAGTVAKENSSNTISNNIIYGFKLRGLDVSATGSTAWTISGNNFYNGNVTAALNYPASSTLHGVRILGGSGYFITNNYIGGSAINASGTNALYSSTLGDVSYQGIALTTTSATPASNIKSNTIAAISVSSVPGSAGSIAFVGIETNGSGINIGGSSTGEGNIIGSASANSSITISTATTSVINTSLIKGISCTSSGGAIMGNQVAGFDIANIGTAPASSAFYGISINAASAPSQVLNNIIGSRETSNSIRVVSTSTAEATSLAGISIGSSVNSAITISGNMVENISQLSTTSSGSFTGINNSASSGTITITTDTIQNITSVLNAHVGSTIYSGIIATSASSITNNIISNILQASSGLNAQVFGINVSGAFAYTITGNFISSLSSASAKTTTSVETGASSSSAIAGILNSATVAGQTISGNTLYDLNATNTSGINTVVTGIGIAAIIAGNIYNNRLASFTNQASGSGPGIVGLMAANGAFNVYNNSIKIDNSAYVNGMKMYGIIHAAGNNWNYFHNTVRIAGTATGTVLRSAAFIRPVTGSLVLKNNVFVNTRTGTGTNYAISNLASPASTNWLSSASNYNNFYSINANTLGEWGTSTNKTFAQWKTSSGGDANSVSRPIITVASLYDLQPDNLANCALNNSGIPVTSPVVVNTDLNGVSRSSTVPDMGAYEFSTTIFSVSAANNSPVCAGTSASFTSDPGVALNPTYSWINPSGGVVSTAQNPDIAVVTGNYTVTITDGTGCFNSATSAVTLIATPTATLSGPAFICNGNSATLTLALTGSGTINGSLSNGDLFNGIESTITVNVSPSATTQYYITSLSDANCNARPIDRHDSAKVNVLATGDWTGAVSTSWTDAANWSCGGLPPAGSNVTIASGLSFYPVVTGLQSVGNITIAQGASIAVTGTLKIAGNITNNGTFTASAGTIEMNGLTAQTIPSGMLAGNAIKNLIISNNVSLAGQLYVYGAVSFGNINNKTFTTGGYLTLGSLSTGTARVADITNAGVNTGNNISGIVTVEKYIPAKRAYRFLSSPVSTAGSIRTNWMENANNNSIGVNIDPVPGYGTQITGSGGGSNGFDATTTNNASLYNYNNQTQLWAALPNTSSVLNAGNGYRLFIRGNRSTDLLINNPAPTVTTLRAKGTLTTGTVVMSSAGGGGTTGMPLLSSVNNGYSFIGNPYASPVNWQLAERTNVGSSICIFDPTISGSHGRGAYVSYNAALGVNNNSSSLIDNNIQSWQAFFVTTTGSNPTLTFRETHKTNVNRAVFRNAASLPHCNVQLLLPQQAATGIAADGFATYFFDDFSSAIGDEDSYKFSNQDENIAILRSGNLLSLEGRNAITADDTIPIKMWGLSQMSYTFKIGAFNLPGSVTCYLRDEYLQSNTIIAPDTEVFISFSITTDTASYSGRRFSIIFNTPRILPIQLSAINAYEKNKGAEIEWTAFNENKTDHYEIERSKDARSFELIGRVQPSSNSSLTALHSWHDAAPVKGDNFYRVKVISSAGVSFTNIAKVNFSGNKNSVVILLNPVENNKINVMFNDLAKGEYVVKLLTMAGQQMYAGTIMHNGGSAVHQIRLPVAIAQGVYHLYFSDGNNQFEETVIFK